MIQMKCIGSITCKLILTISLGMSALPGLARAEDAARSDSANRSLPDWYSHIAPDILEWCKPEAGVWLRFVKDAE